MLVTIITMKVSPGYLFHTVTESYYPLARVRRELAKQIVNWRDRELSFSHEKEFIFLLSFFFSTTNWLFFCNQTSYYEPLSTTESTTTTTACYYDAQLWLDATFWNMYHTHTDIAVSYDALQILSSGGIGGGITIVETATTTTTTIRSCKQRYTTYIIRAGYLFTHDRIYGDLSFTRLFQLSFVPCRCTTTATGMQLCALQQQFKSNRNEPCSHDGTYQHDATVQQCIFIIETQ